MHMGIALQLLFTGLGVGSVYALVALGFVLIYRATNVVNFAQGDFAMLGAFSMVVLCIDLQLPYWLGILITRRRCWFSAPCLISQSTTHYEIAAFSR
jgi:branched-chain amino acid transport system permease protein